MKLIEFTFIGGVEFRRNYSIGFFGLKIFKEDFKSRSG